MTYEEAISRIVNYDEIRSRIEALNMVVKALEKQIPQKPLEENRYYGNGKCPRCNAVFLDKSTNYCGNCGQALDWSDD